MKTTILAVLATSLFLFSGCVAPKTAFVPPPGGIYTNYKAPLIVDYDETALGSNSGNASTEYLHVPFILGGLLQFAWDDCSLDAAVKNGRISRAGVADYEFFSVLGVYAKTTVHVYEAPADK